MFNPVEDLNFPILENVVLKFWQENRTFERLRAQNKGKPRFSFMDGPITANNPRGIGVHHAWGRTYKDVFQRYKAMQGYDQRYQNGFDCQGLWVEVEVEKELGLNAKNQILAYGLDRFARRCRQRVDQSAQAMVHTSKRLGQWMDWDNSYYTYSDANIEQIWRFLHQCHTNGWLYQGQRVMPWCVRCGTSLSQHELADAYTDTTHTAVYFTLPFKDRPNERALVWTTTPWTLCAHVALAVHPDLTYVKVQHQNQTLYLARDAAARLNLQDQVVAQLSGADLVGRPYSGPFDHLPAQHGVDHRVIPWSEVNATEGSGLVHIAPGCGDEDYQLGQRFGLPALNPLDDDGRYTNDYGPLSGQPVGSVNALVFAHLEQHGMLHKLEEYTHRYPRCWRCKEELVYRLVGEWFIACNEIRPRMLDAARQVDWLPPHAGKRMEDWLHNMGDWCISRKRYWGLPLPFYQSDDGQLLVVHSKAHLRQLATTPKAVDALPELHRPWIDSITLRLPNGQLARRVPEVGDCWLDAGIVPFSTLDFSRNNNSQWDRWYPADFVVEMQEQIRLWFYSMLFMGVTLVGRAPYKRVMVYDKMHDEHGHPMHKSAGNALWFDTAVEETGAEPMRWLFARQNLTLNIHFGTGPASQIKRRFLTLWNTYRFFVQYARLDGFSPSNHAAEAPAYTPTDRWLLAALQALVAQVHHGLETYDLPPAVRAMEDFFETLSNWYLRLNRRRFWKSEDDADKTAAYSALYQTLVTLSRLMAPILPFLSETLYQNLVRTVDSNAPQSVHLCPFPSVLQAHVNEPLLQDMALIQRLVRLGRAARAAQNLKVRQPLRQALVYLNTPQRPDLTALEPLVLQELNIKSLQWVNNTDRLTHQTLTPNFRVLGQRYKHLVPQIQTALQTLDHQTAAQTLEAGQPIQLQLENQIVPLDQDTVILTAQPHTHLTLQEENGLTLALDTRLDTTLRNEGLARELVHQVQELRKKSGLAVDDRITLNCHAAPSVLTALEHHADYIRHETLCTKLSFVAASAGEELCINGHPVLVSLAKHSE